MLLSFAIHAAKPLVESPVPIFLIVLAIILLVPILLNRFKIPPIIGFIVAGVVVGPYGLNWLARDMSFEVFGQVGVLYLMFLAGLEIDLFNLRKNLRKGMAFGTLTFLIPLVIGSIVGVTLLGMSMLSALLLASMFAAHTLIGYPIVARYGLTKNPAVVIAVAGTIFTVIGSLLVLAGVMGVVESGEFSFLQLLRLLGSLVAYCFVVAWLYPRLTRRFFRGYTDGILQFVYILAMTFLAAQAAVWIGLEGVFGAFYAGIVLGRYVPARSPLMGRLEFVGNALFIPYFLIEVGMLINIKVVASSWDTVYVAAVMSSTAMIVKWLAAYATQRIYHLSAPDRSMLYQLSNAHTAVALAVVMIGFSTGIFGEEVLNGTVMMILVTCTVSSVGVTRAASRLKIIELEKEQEYLDALQTPDSTQPVNTLIPVVNPMSATELVSLALLIRPEGRSAGNMYALHVRTDNSAMSRSVARNSLDVARKVAASVDAGIETIERYDLNFVTGLINVVEERDISQVIIGLHRRTLFIDSFFGDKLTQILKATGRMVLIVRLFIPPATLMRIHVAVSEKAQFEVGFRQWVRAVANLTRQIGCRVIFYCTDDTRRAIETVMCIDRFDISRSYSKTSGFDDYVLLANKIEADDLLVAVTARRGSISFTADMDTLPEFLRHNFSATNLMVVYPEQSADATAPDIATLANSMIADVTVAPSPVWLRLRGWAIAVYEHLRGK